MSNDRIASFLHAASGEELSLSEKRVGTKSTGYILAGVMLVGSAGRLN